MSYSILNNVCEITLRDAFFALWSPSLVYTYWTSATIFQIDLYLLCWQIWLPSQSVHLDLRFWCWQIALPLQSLHCALCLWCWQIALPLQSLHCALRLWCWHLYFSMHTVQVLFGCLVLLLMLNSFNERQILHRLQTFFPSFDNWKVNTVFRVVFSRTRHRFLPCSINKWRQQLRKILKMWKEEREPTKPTWEKSKRASCLPVLLVLPLQVLPLPLQVLPVLLSLPLPLLSLPIALPF